MDVKCEDTCCVFFHETFHKSEVKFENREDKK